MSIKTVTSNNLTFIDTSDERKLEIDISPNKPLFQIYNPNVDPPTFTPDWKENNLVINVYVGVDSIEVTNNKNDNDEYLTTISWKKQFGVEEPIDIENVREPLVISENDLVHQSGIVTYICTATYDGMTATKKITFTRNDNGENGVSQYFHIKYSNDGINFTGNNGEDIGDWIGIYVDNTKDDPLDFDIYEWRKIKGEQGLPGKDGVGIDGTSSYFHVRYSEVENPTVEQMTENPSKYIGTYVDNVEDDSNNPNDYRWVQFMGTDGIPGINGTDGKTYYLHIKYSDDGGATFTNNNGEDSGKYIGVYTDIVEQDSDEVSQYKWSLIKGEDGLTYYTWIKYADTPTSGMSDDPDGKTYMGLAYNKTSKEESSNYSDYTWSLIKGKDGVDGGKGKDGVTYYTWIKYADDINGTNMSDDPTGKEYIGLAYNKTTSTESNEATDYKWALFKGSDGVDGKDGQTTYFHIKYSDVLEPTSSQMSETPSKYIGTYVDFNATDSTDPKKYNWVQLQGENGKDGLPGVNGEDGLTYYLHIKYSDDGGNTFTSNNGEDTGEYIGIYTDTVEKDSDDKSKYKWSLMKGTDGVNGITFTISGDNGLVLTEDTPSTTLTALAFDGSTKITDANYQWSYQKKGDENSDTVVNGNWIIADSTTNSLTVNKDEVAGSITYKCEMTYPSTNGKTYIAMATVTDYNDIYDSYIEVSKTIKTNDGKCYWVLSAIVWSENGESDPLLGNIFTEAPAIDTSLESQYYYHIDISESTVTLKQPNSSKDAWIDATDVSQKYIYSWNGTNGNKVIVVSSDDVYNSETFRCEVSDGASTLAVSSINLTDTTDPIISSNDPSKNDGNKIKDGQIWIDTSDSDRPLTKIYDESSGTWTIISEKNKVYTSKPESYRKGDLWVTQTNSDCKYLDASDKEQYYAALTLLVAKQNMNGSFNDYDWELMIEYGKDVGEIKADLQKYKNSVQVNTDGITIVAIDSSGNESPFSSRFTSSRLAFLYDDSNENIVEDNETEEEKAKTKLKITVDGILTPKIVVENAAQISGLKIITETNGSYSLMV